MKRNNISREGYRFDSPDRFNPFNIIPSNLISMRNVKLPIFAESDTGERRVMYPDEEHSFHGARFVKEIPLRKAQVGARVGPFGLKNPFEENRMAGADESPINSNPPIVGPTPGSRKGQFNNQTNQDLTFLPLFMNSILLAASQKVEDNRQKGYVNSNLANPFNYIPMTNNTNSYANYGQETYQSGGGVGGGNSQDEYNDEDFLWQDDAPQDIPQQDIPIDHPQDTPQVDLVDPDNQVIQLNKDYSDIYAGEPEDQGNPLTQAKPDIGMTTNGESLEDSITRVESGGNYSAQNPHSSAVGKYQFLWNTWKGDINQVTGITSKEQFRSNPEAQESFYQWYKQNKMLPAVQRLKQYNNKNLSDEQLSKLYHFKGEQGAMDYLIQGVDKTTSFNTSIQNYIE